MNLQTCGTRAARAAYYVGNAMPLPADLADIPASELLLIQEDVLAEQHADALNEAEAKAFEEGKAELALALKDAESERDHFQDEADRLEQELNTALDSADVPSAAAWLAVKTRLLRDTLRGVLDAHAAELRDAKTIAARREIAAALTGRILAPLGDLLAETQTYGKAA